MDVLARNNVKVSGRTDAQPMVFAHGFGCDQNMWRFVTPAFEDDYRIVLFDHVGAGASDLSAYSFERYALLDAYAEDVLDICRELDLSDVIFIGHSVSAMIGILAAVREPNRFAKLVLVGPSPRYIDDSDYVGGFTKDGEAVFSTAPELHDEALSWLDTGGAPAALAALAIGVGDRVAGVLCLGFDTAREFASEDREFAVACARQCSQALERVRLHEETSRAAERAEFLARTSRVLAEGSEIVERAQRLVELLVLELAEAASVYGGDADPLALAHRDERARSALSDNRAAVELPLVAGQLRGKLVLVPVEPPPLPRRMMSFLLDLADRCALALENARLYEQERDAAQTLQRSLLAQQLPRDSRFVIATSYRPAVERLEVGGDWYDAFAVSPDIIAVVVGDVVGRGLEAATAMGQLRSAVRALASAEQGPARLLDNLDRFVEPLERARAATVAYAEIALDSGIMRFASAGHPAPLLLDSQETPRFLWNAQSTPLGANFSGVPRPEAQLTLRPGARLLLYTDGLIERRGEPLDAGLERLAQRFAARRTTPLPALVNELADDMRAGARSDDDVCLLCFSFAGPARATAASRDAGRLTSDD